MKGGGLPGLVLICGSPSPPTGTFPKFGEAVLKQHPWEKHFIEKKSGRKCSSLNDRLLRDG